VAGLDDFAILAGACNELGTGGTATEKAKWSQLLSVVFFMASLGNAQSSAI
jgi:hypothetical protein